MPLFPGRCNNPVKSSHVVAFQIKGYILKAKPFKKLFHAFAHRNLHDLGYNKSFNFQSNNFIVISDSYLTRLVQFPEKFFISFHLAEAFHGYGNVIRGIRNAKQA